MLLELYLYGGTPLVGTRVCVFPIESAPVFGHGILTENPFKVIGVVSMIRLLTTVKVRTADSTPVPYSALALKLCAATLNPDTSSDQTPVVAFAVA